LSTNSYDLSTKLLDYSLPHIAKEWQAVQHFENENINKGSYYF